ncbi:MAG: hypothetical protein HZB41_05465 [Ignavibacteriae bacterium]|nr:hypothetical protein [Ignavibacteriota bacterium]
MNNSSGKKENISDKIENILSKHRIFLLLILIISLIISPIIFSKLSLTTLTDLTKTGQIGDTIGGITAPLIGLIAALLIYLSFKEQYKANIENKNSQKLQYYFDFISDINHDIDTFVYSKERYFQAQPQSNNPPIISSYTLYFNGSFALYEFISDFPNVYTDHTGISKIRKSYTDYQELNLLLFVFRNLDEIIKKANVDLNNNEKKLILNKIKILYQAKVELPAYNLIKKLRENYSDWSIDFINEIEKICKIILSL